MDKLYVGYARESFLPDKPVSMAGSGNDAHRVSTESRTDMCATCIAFTQGENTVLLYSTDTLAARTWWTEEARNLIFEATGVPQTNIQIGGTHCHSGPSVGWEQCEGILAWKPKYMTALVEAAKKALADRAPGKLFCKRVETDRMNFARHYIMADGSYAGSNFGDRTKGFVKHVGEPDKEIQLVKICREGEKKDILMMNFQVHPCQVRRGEYTLLHADFIGETRTILEEKTGMDFIYFTGAAGNMTSTSSIKGETRDTDVWVYSELLSNYVLEALPEITEPLADGPVRACQKIVEYKSNDYGKDRLDDARLVTEMFGKTGDATASSAYAKELGFHSVYECTGIVNCSRYEPTQLMELNVVGIGDLGFVAASYEMFSQSGLAIKAGSPFPMTFISTCTNGYNAYFPTRDAYVYGCYESFTARFASGVAEDTVDAFVEMLKSIR
ncbi:MAG: hypothetical protein IKJ94_00620 [Oscillospiraceae bacterium]|nr:hypothetical protein [Oscillospiraceae bacterium]